MPALLAFALISSATLAPLSSAHSMPSWVLPGAPLADQADEQAALIAGLAKRGLHDMVVREAKSYLQQYSSHKSSSAVRYRLAGAYFDLGRIQDALNEYQTLDRVVGFDQATEVKFRLGQCALELGQTDLAAKNLAAVTKGSTGYLITPASYLLGEALFRGNKFPEAGAAYGSVLARTDDQAADYARDARYGVTWSAWKAKNLDRTIQGAADFLKNHGTDEQAGEMAFLAGEAYLESGRPEEAIQWYGRVSKGDYLEAALRGAGFAEVARREPAKAAARFQAYLQKFPSGEFAAEVALQRGVQLIRAKDFEGAISALSSAPTVQDAQSSYWLSTAYTGASRHEEALAAAKSGLAKGPDETLAVQLRIAAGDALFELGRSKEAAALYEQSGSAYALHAAAVARLNAGDAEEAERLAATLLNGAAREPGSEFRAEALLARAEALFRMERYGESEPLLRSLISESKNSQAETAASMTARASSRLAWCRWYADSPEEARPLFVSAAMGQELTPTERAEALFMSGRAALLTGDEGGARQAFSAYIEGVGQGGAFADEALLRIARIVPGTEGAAFYGRLIADHPQSDLVPAALSESAERWIEAGDAERGTAAYARLVNDFPEHPLSRNARYGLGWSRYQAGEFAAATGPLWAVARDEGATDELRDASLELLVWSFAKAKDPKEAASAFRAFASRSSDEGRLLAAARVVDGALVDAGDTASRKGLWQSLSTKLKSPDTVGALRVEEGFVALDEGNVQVAAQKALAAREAQPKSPDVAELLFFVGEAYFDAGDDERAAPLYVAASEHATPEVAERALYKGGFAELRRGENAAAAKAFGALVQRFPKGVLAPESMFLGGEALYREGQYESAVTSLRAMVKDYPTHASRAKALFRLGLAEGQLENWGASADALGLLVSRHADFPSLTEAELWRGRALSRRGDRRAARQSLARVIEADEGVLAAQARIETGRIFEAENDAESALSEYLKVAVLYGHAEECAEALVRAGDVLAKTGEGARSKERYQEVLDEYPDTTYAKVAKERLAEKS